MKNYLTLSSKYAALHKRKTRLTLYSVVMAVALISGIFSMLDSLVHYERIQVLKQEGNYHILVRRPSEKEINAISSRIDVENTGSLKDLGQGALQGKKCALAFLDENFAKNLNLELAEGKYPADNNEIMLERWFMDSFAPALQIGSKVMIKLPDGSDREFTISGIFGDWGATKAAGIPGVILSAEDAEKLTPVTNDYFILFKEGVQIAKAEREIKKTLGITEERIARNDRLLALMLQTTHNRIIEFYLIGAILFTLVLVTGVVMIYNTFNISVMERVQHFGLLRCIGASPAQIKRLVRREGLHIAMRAIPIGVLIGVVLASVCSSVLKYFNPNIYGSIPLFHVSALGIGFGVVMGFVTVYIASFSPAKKAAKVSPVGALSGSREVNISKSILQGLLMKAVHPEVAMGVGHAMGRKKTLVLMSCSIAFSITIFLGFNVLVNPKYSGMKGLAPYEADVSLISKEPIETEVFSGLSDMKQIKRVYGRRTNYVEASFRADRITDAYKKVIGEVKTEENVLLEDPEKSWLISYDAIQLGWAKEYVKEGILDEKLLNEKNGVIAVEKNWRKNAMLQSTKLQIGDTIYIETASGTKEMKVMAVCESIPYVTEELTMTTFVTTESLFAELTGDTAYREIDIQLKDRNNDEAFNEIKGLVGPSVSVLDKRQYNEQGKNAYMTIAVFIYGFVGIIGLISMLNIMNTMNASIEAKTKYVGIMRAIGMSDGQLSIMVLAEAAIYTLCGCLLGSVMGMLLQKAFADFFKECWNVPFLQIGFIIAICMVIGALSILSPLKRLKSRGISETITTLR